MKSKTILLSWRALPLIASAALILAGCNNQDAEPTAQREKELESVHAELEQAKTSAAAQESELTRLRKDNQELLRLRNEVRQLREDKKQLASQTAAAQNVRVAAQQQEQQLRQLQAENQQYRTVFQQEQQVAMRNACINYLRQFDGAKQQWALENRKSADAIPNEQDIARYLKGNVLPTCPAGGTYTLNAVSTNPTCSIPGHALPR
jgi:predicted RNase H-like nuclease (RuvC/YqgF family)